MRGKKKNKGLGVKERETWRWEEGQSVLNSKHLWERYQCESGKQHFGTSDPGALSRKCVYLREPKAITTKLDIPFNISKGLKREVCLKVRVDVEELLKAMLV